jgi:hypothetical protein
VGRREREREGGGIGGGELRGRMVVRRIWRCVDVCVMLATDEF